VHKYISKIDKKLFNFRLLLLFAFIVVCSLYVGTLLYGKNSLDVLTKLEKQEQMLKKEIKYLLANNAKLQKEYFELKNLEQ